MQQRRSTPTARARDFGVMTVTQVQRLVEENRLLRLEVARLRRVLFEKSTPSSMRQYLQDKQIDGEERYYSVSDPSIFSIENKSEIMIPPPPFSSRRAHAQSSVQGSPVRTLSPKHEVLRYLGIRDPLDVKGFEWSSAEETYSPKTPDIPDPTLDNDVTLQMEMVIQADMDRRLSGHMAYSRRKTMPAKSERRSERSIRQSKASSSAPRSSTLAKEKSRRQLLKQSFTDIPAKEFPCDIDADSLDKPLEDSSTLRDVLDNKIGMEFFSRFVEKERSDENLRFLEEAEAFTQAAEEEIDDMVSAMKKARDALLGNQSMELNGFLDELKKTLTTVDASQVVSIAQAAKIEIQKLLAVGMADPTGAILRNGMMSEQECKDACRCFELPKIDRFPLLVAIYRVSGCSVEKFWQLKVSLKGTNRDPISRRTTIIKDRTDIPEWNTLIRFEDAKHDEYLQIVLQKKHHLITAGACGYAKIKLEELRTNPILHLSVPLYKSKSLTTHTKYTVHLSIVVDPDLTAST
ncbi:hypothetical protein AAMO2058_000647600 [Amorphochlora amoebiformis]